MCFPQLAPVELTDTSSLPKPRRRRRRKSVGATDEATSEHFQSHGTISASTCTRKRRNSPIVDCASIAGYYSNSFNQQLVLIQPCAARLSRICTPVTLKPIAHTHPGLDLVDRRCHRSRGLSTEASMAGRPLTRAGSGTEHGIKEVYHNHATANSN